MAQKATDLAFNVSVVADTSAVLFHGGRGVLVTEATTYPTTCQLQMQAKSGKWIPIGSNTNADGAVSLDLPAGQYRMHMVGGAAAALYATLVSIVHV